MGLSVPYHNYAVDTSSWVTIEYDSCYIEPVQDTPEPALSIHEKLFKEIEEWTKEISFDEL